MKQITITTILASTLLLFNCSAGGTQKNDNTKAVTPAKEASTSTKKTAVVHITAEEFKKNVFDYSKNKEWKYEGDKPCILDFYATWCGPCKMVAPILDELSVEYADKLIVYKIDTDQEQELAQAMGIRALPTIVFIPVNGKPQGSQGAMAKADFVKAINEILLTK